MSRLIRIGDIPIGEGAPLVWIAGPCVIEDEASVLRTAGALKDISTALRIPLIFKASFDKANRTSLDSFRGPGLHDGLRILKQVKRTLQIPVTTDIHRPKQAKVAAEVVDLLQIPAFLCRQTDLLVAAGATRAPVNVKKGQFLAPADMAHVVDKVRRAGAASVIVTERGTMFGYGDLVADMRSIARLAALDVPVCFDATHSVQQRLQGGSRSGGERHLAPTLAYAAVAAGADVLFTEIHEDPERALSDAATQLPLDECPRWLKTVTQLAAVVRRRRR